MIGPANKLGGSRLRRGWRIAAYAVRFFAPILGRLAWQAGLFVGALVAFIVSLRWAAEWTAAWAPDGSRWSETGLATVTISWACASTLTLLVVMLGYVRMTRTSIGVICGYLFAMYLPLLLVMRPTGSPFSSFPPSIFLCLLPMFVMQEVVAHVKPWKNESWNGKRIRQRWNESWLGGM